LYGITVVKQCSGKAGMEMFMASIIVLSQKWPMGIGLADVLSKTGTVTA
jgi:hypothetical protein